MIVSAAIAVTEAEACFGAGHLDGFISVESMTSTENKTIFSAEKCCCVTFTVLKLCLQRII